MNLPYENSYINLPLFSALFFITNSMHAFYNNTRIYAIVFAILTITSLIHHSPSLTNSYTYTIDRIAILFVVCCGGFILYKKSKNIINKKLFFEICIIFLVIIAFFATIYLYYYGALQQKYCFNPNKNIANISHSFMHVISSAGHHLIMLL
jgi:hypothetical protein